MLEGFLWLQENCESYCITFARGLSETELLHRFGGDLSRARLVQSVDGDVDAIEKLRQFGEVALVGWCDEWAFVYEDTGFQGSLPEVLRAISAGTVAVSVSRSVNADTYFCYAEDGAIITDFDTLAPPFEDASPRVLGLLHQAGLSPEDVEDDDYDFVGAMFALAEATGVRLSREAIAEKPLLCSFIRNPFSDFVEDLLTRGSNEQTIHHLLNILEDQEQKERLFHILNDRYQTEYLHSVAISIVRALLSAQVIQPLLRVLSEEKQETRAVVSKMLQILISFAQKFNEDGAREALLALTSAVEPEVALQATLALGRLGDQRAVHLLLHLLPLHPGEREIIQLLGQLRASSAAEVLFSMLDPHGKSTDPFDERISFQSDVIDALEQIEGRQIVERLMPLLHPEPQTIMECSFQQSLLALLARQGGTRVVEPLLKLLNPHPKPMYPYDFQLRLLEALGNLGERQAIEPLAHLLILDLGELSIYEQIFQEYLVKALRQLGDTRAELQAVELALQRRMQTGRLTAKAEFRLRRQNINH